MADGEMEIGMGIHGEPGIRKGPLETADKVVDEILDRFFRILVRKGGTRSLCLLTVLVLPPKRRTVYHLPSGESGAERERNHRY
ncbi:dihydroxyacetone kinase subunit DhaK [Marispirochaeta sp.]|uniref:dihydroxyacetone kinase subunit DhaK n=1 Tax=Marispirochaeta sp. TaxID=2038653 RepID=UPI0029C8A387|nr:dihydroxyacetone kinase subunit DhaK [Marispirochaeta sp.]